MFSLRDLRFLHCSLDLDVLRAQRIIGFLKILITHKSTVSNSDSTERRDESDRESCTFSVCQLKITKVAVSVCCTGQFLMQLNAARKLHEILPLIYSATSGAHYPERPSPILSLRDNRCFPRTSVSAAVRIWPKSTRKGTKTVEENGRRMRDFTLVAIFFSVDFGYMRTEAETDVRGKYMSKNSSVWAWDDSRIQCRWTLRVMGSWQRKRVQLLKGRQQG